MTATFEEARDIEQRGLETMLENLKASIVIGMPLSKSLGWLEGYVEEGAKWKIEA